MFATWSKPSCSWQTIGAAGPSCTTRVIPGRRTSASSGASSAVPSEETYVCCRSRARRLYAAMRVSTLGQWPVRLQEPARRQAVPADGRARVRLLERSASTRARLATATRSCRGVETRGRGLSRSGNACSLAAARAPSGLAAGLALEALRTGSGFWAPIFPRSATTMTSRRPDQVSSIAQTLLSTNERSSAIRRTTSSVRSVSTPEARLGQAIHRPAAGSMRFCRARSV